MTQIGLLSRVEGAIFSLVDFRRFFSSRFTHALGAFSSIYFIDVRRGKL